MCAKGNGSISKECWKQLLKQTGRPSLSNQEARRLLAAQGGCASDWEPKRSEVAARYAHNVVVDVSDGPDPKQQYERLRKAKVG